MADDISAAADATQTEITRYEKAYRETRRAADESIELLTLLQNFELDLNKQGTIGEKILKLEGQRKDLVTANLEFHMGRAVMDPPSPQLVDEILDNTRAVVELTVEKATVAAVLRIATKAFTQFAEIQKI